MRVIIWLGIFIVFNWLNGGAPPKPEIAISMGLGLIYAIFCDYLEMKFWMQKGGD